MNKNYSLHFRKMYVLAFVSILLLFGSCTLGYDSPSGFDVGVNNQQVVTPDSVSFTVNTEGTAATISWPLVMGAKGYEVTFINVDNPDEPFVVDTYNKTLVDGSKMTATVTEDSKYQLILRALGDSERGNTDDPDSVIFNLSTLVPSVATIPDGSDIYQYLQENPIDSVGGEAAIDLVAGGRYTISGPVDFGGQKMTFRGDKINRATVEMTGDGGFLTYSGLKVKYINFDMANSTAKSFISMSGENLPDRILSQNLGYMRDGSAINDIYIVEDPIYIANCWFKDMPAAIIFDNEIQCAFWHFTITDCIVQMKNTGNVFVNLQKKGRCIKNLTFKNSTLFNVEDCGTYFMRYSNSSNSNPQKTFGNTSSEYSSASITFSNTTFSKTFSKKDFQNNFNATGMTTNIDHCIFYDCRRVRKVFLGMKTFKFNFWYAVTDPDTADPTQKDNSGAPFASVYDPIFGGDITQSLDFTKPDGGVDFTPGEYEIVANSGGDPRWLAK